MRRGEGNVGGWRDFGNEHHLIDDQGQLLARVAKHGCCWRGYIGMQAHSCGRFRNVDDAKRAVENLMKIGAREIAS
jgi:hypothetical protein